MDDAAIVALFWHRDERAIGETERKYGPYCRSIAGSLLVDARDVEETLSDTWLQAWRSIPPQRPVQLATYVGKLTRNLALSRVRELQAQKRGGGEAELALEELADCLRGSDDPEAALEARELGRTLNRFVAGLRKQERDIFISRYYFLVPLGELSRITGCTQGKLKSILFRTRKKLNVYLRKEGYC